MVDSGGKMQRSRPVGLLRSESVAPRLRATGLPCIASPETMSSGNTQHLGTENNRFIDASGTEFILQQWSRPSGTLGAAEQYVHYLVNIKGPRLEQLRGSGITS